MTKLMQFVRNESGATAIEYGLIAAGMGSFSMALVTRWLGLPSETIPAGGAAGSAAYLVGVFGPAVIEMTLARLRQQKGGPDA